MRAVLIVLALAAGCSSGPRQELPAPELPQRAGIDPIVAARAQGVAFRGTGQAPDFVLDVYREDRITLAWDYGARQETFPKPAPILPRWNGEIYETRNERHTLRIEIRRNRCETEHGEMALADVRVELDGVEWRGCGRDL